MIVVDGKTVVTKDKIKGIFGENKKVNIKDLGTQVRIIIVDCSVIFGNISALVLLV